LAGSNLLRFVQALVFTTLHLQRREPILRLALRVLLLRQFFLIWSVLPQARIFAQQILHGFV
jgi:hypothetical protein